MLPSGFSTSWQEAEVRRTLPVTVAGPRRILTGFPSTDRGRSLSARRSVRRALPCDGARGRRRHPRRLGRGRARRAAALERHGDRRQHAVGQPLGDPPGRHLLQLRPLRAVGRSRGGPRVRVPRPGDRAGHRVGAGARSAAHRGTHARGLHVRGVSRKHGLPRPSLHSRPARARRAAGGDHLRPARVHAVAAGGRILDRGHPSRRAARRASAACARS